MKSLRNLLFLFLSCFAISACASEPTPSVAVDTSAAMPEVAATICPTISADQSMYSSTVSPWLKTAGVAAWRGFYSNPGWIACAGISGILIKNAYTQRSGLNYDLGVLEDIESRLKEKNPKKLWKDFKNEINAMKISNKNYVALKKSISEYDSAKHERASFVPAIQKCITTSKEELKNKRWKKTKKMATIPVAMGAIALVSYGVSAVATKVANKF
jgi:hypothetical protein